MNEKKIKPIYKRWWFWAIIVFIGIGAIASANEKPKTEKQKAVEAAAKVKEEEAKIVAEKEKKAVEKKAIKASYLKNTKPNVDKFIHQYDDIWNTLWKPSFDTISSGDYQNFKVYADFIEAGKLYDLLQSDKSLKAPKEMADADKKNFNDFDTNIRSAAMVRKEATDLAAEMVDKQDFSPSQMYKIKEKISTSDSHLKIALQSLHKIESKYGIER